MYRGREQNGGVGPCKNNSQSKKGSPDFTQRFFFSLQARFGGCNNDLKELEKAL